jgi:hypothetical protein
MEELGFEIPKIWIERERFGPWYSKTLWQAGKDGPEDLKEVFKSFYVSSERASHELLPKAII